MLDLLFPFLSLIAHLLVLPFYKDPTDYYYFSLLIGSSALSLYSICGRFRKRRIHFEWHEFVIFVVILGLGICLYDAKSIWLDEYSQSFLSGEAQQCLSCSAGLEQQPPLSYVFSSFAQRYIGKNVLGLRVFPLIFFSLSCVYFWRILKFFKVSTMISVIGLALYGMNSEIFNLATEARPYSLFLMTSLWCLLNYLKLYDDQSKVSASELWASVIFLLVSIGLQAQILAFTFFILYILKYRRKVRPDLLLVNIALGLLFIPLLKEVYVQSSVMEQFKEINFNLWPFLRFTVQYFEGLSLVLGPLQIELILGIAFFLLNLRRHFRSVKYLLGIFLVFSVVFIFTYFIFVNWTVFGRYYLISFVLIILMFLIGVQTLVNDFTRFLPRYLVVAVALIFCLRGLVFLFEFEETSMVFQDSRQVKWKSFYEKIKENYSSKDRLYFLTFSAFGEWYQFTPIAAEYYLEEEKLGSIVGGNQNSKLPMFNNEILLDGDVFIVSAQIWSKDTINDQFVLGKLSNLEVLYVDSVRVFRLKKNGKTQKQRLVDFLSVVTDEYGNLSWSAPAWFAKGEICRLLEDTKCLDESINGLAKLYIPQGTSSAGALLERERHRERMIYHLNSVERSN